MVCRGQRLIEKGHVALKDMKHGVMVYASDHPTIGRSLDLYGEWCEQELLFLEKVLSPGSSVVEIEANIGAQTLFFAEKVTPKGKVFALESEKTPFQMLCGNVSMNDCQNVETLPFKAGKKNEEGQVTIDSLAVSACELIKINLKGRERAIFQGAKETIQKQRPFLFFEGNLLDNSSFMKEQNYRCYKFSSPYFNESNFFRNPINLFDKKTEKNSFFCAPAEKVINFEELEEVSYG